MDQKRHLFAVLDLEVSLQITSDSVDLAWRGLSSSAHPDAAGSEEAAAMVNHARETLLTPVGLLEQWLLAKGQSVERQTSISTKLMDLFSSVGECIQQADEVIARHNKATTALTKSLLAAPAIEAQKAIQGALAEITGSTNDRVATFSTIETSEDWSLAQEVLNELKFLAKWSQQCQQRLIGLIAI